MKRFILFAIALVMTACMMASCASVNNKQLEIVVGQNEGVQATLGTVVNNNIQPDPNNANREPTVNIIVPDNIVVDNNTGSGNNANTNTGNTNTGDTNNGDANNGDANLNDQPGDTNTGDTNTGDTNTGDTNTGDTNTGDTNNGDTNNGDANTGDTNNGDANTGDENGDTNNGDENGDTNTGDENGDEEKPAINPDDKSSGYYKVISYNLKAMYYDRFNPDVHKDQREGVANYLKEHDADIIGLQEIDCNNPRSFSYDQMKYLSEQLGYDYFYCDAMNYEDKGYQYGTGILSRYPIKDAKKVYYDVQDSRTTEKRAYGRVVIEFPEGDLVFYNTHLCTASSTDPNGDAAKQFNQVLRAMYNEKGPAVLTADYNIVLEVRSQIVDHNKVTQLNGGKDQIFFTEGLPIDDIYIRNLDYYTNESDGLSIFKHEADVAPWSDHIPCWGYFKFKGK